MTYPENLFLAESANRDSTVPSAEKPDNQLVFDFYKKIVSAEKAANNRSVNDPWQEAYEAGFRAGVRQGVK